MANRKKWTVRKTFMGNDRACSAYLVERSEPVGRSISSGFRFGKVAMSEAKTFRTETEATKIMRSMKRQDNSATYAVVSL